MKTKAGRGMVVLVSLLLIAASASAQTPPATLHLEGPQVVAAFSDFMKNSPSKEEVSALLNKADQKVSEFESIVNTLKPNLEKAHPGAAKDILVGAANAHKLISGMQTKGPSARGLVGVLSVLDDLSRSASRESVLLLVDGGVSPSVVTEVTALSSAGNALYDISELVFHATFRAVGAADDLISQLMNLLK